MKLATLNSFVSQPCLFDFSLSAILPNRPSTSWLCHLLFAMPRSPSLSDTPPFYHPTRVDHPIFNFYTRPTRCYQFHSILFPSIPLNQAGPNTLLKTLPRTPLTLLLFSSTHVKTTAVLNANANRSLHCLSASYCLGNSVANARGATNNPISFLLPAFSIKILQPQRKQPVPTQIPPSILLQASASLPNIRGPMRVRDRQTP